MHVLSRQEQICSMLVTLSAQPAIECGVPANAACQAAGEHGSFKRTSLEARDYANFAYTT